jgi:hypothetical protein
VRTSHVFAVVMVCVCCTATALADVLLQADLEGVRYTVEGPAPCTVPAGEPFAVTVRAEPTGFQGDRPLQITGGSATATLVVPDDAVGVSALPEVAAYYPELHLPEGAQTAEGWRPLKVRSEIANKAWKLAGRTARQLIGMVPGVGPVVGISRLVGDLANIAVDKPEDWLTLAKLENAFDTYDYDIPQWNGTISALQVKWSVQLEPRVTAAVPVTLALQFSTQRTPLFLSTLRGARLAVELPAPKVAVP